MRRRRTDAYGLWVVAKVVSVTGMVARAFETTYGTVMFHAFPRIPTVQEVSHSRCPGSKEVEQCCRAMSQVLVVEPAAVDQTLPERQT